MSSSSLQEMQNRKSSQNESANHTADKEMEDVKTQLNNIKQVNKVSKSLL